MVQALFFNHLYDPNSLVRDNEVKAAMAGMGVACQSFNSDLLFEPWEVLSDEGEPLTCFQEYWDRSAHLCHSCPCHLLQPHAIFRSRHDYLRPMVLAVTLSMVCMSSAAASAATLRSRPIRAAAN